MSEDAPAARFYSFAVKGDYIALLAALNELPVDDRVVHIESIYWRSTSEYGVRVYVERGKSETEPGER